MERIIRVLIADNKWRTRQSLRALLENVQTFTPDAEPVRITIVGDTNNGQEALKLVETLTPHVVVMDVTMPSIDGLEATHLIKAHHPDIRVIILTLYDALRTSAAAAGADAFLVKGCPIEHLIKAIAAYHKEQVAE